jgi:hypothetical protein
MAKRNSRQSTKESSRNDVQLDSRYGAIGISAVAAALQFKSELVKPAHTSAIYQDDEKLIPSKAA